MVKKLFSIILLLILSFSASASEGTPLSEAEDLPGMVVIALNFIVSIAGVAVFVVLVSGGLMYLTSQGSPMTMARARKRVTRGLLGAVLMLISYLLVWQINPDILGDVFKAPSPSDFVYRASESPPLAQKTVFEYQEMPFGTILETRILAKNISCFKDDQLIDCYSHRQVTEEETDQIRRLLAENFKDIWPDPTREDALIAYLCYDFDGEGNFIDGDPDAPGIQPMPYNDRLDCIERITRALEKKSRTLKELTQELLVLTTNCQCEVCGSCGGCPCPPFGTCCCGCNCSGDPCPDRGRINQIRRELNMNQTLEGKNLLKEPELVKVSVDSYSKMTLVNQIRYLASRFLPPHIESLRVDLGYLEKVEGMYKLHCPYANQITRATFQQLMIEYEDRPLTDLEAVPFCINGQNPVWGEECPEEEQLDVLRWCREYNCIDCDDNGKLDCGECNLDQLERGVPVVSQEGDRTKTSYKCSTYRINQDQGRPERGVEDTIGIMCRIQSGGQICDRMSGHPATFYCANLPEAPLETEEQMRIKAPFIDTHIALGYPGGFIEIGQLVDNAQVYVEEMMSELSVLVNTSAPEITCPAFDKDQPNNLCKLYHLPERCQCNQGRMVTSGPAGCGPGCYSVHGCLCNNCCSCPGCMCTPCLVGGVMHPCPIDLIRQRVAEIKHWYEENRDSVQKRAEQVWNLILAINLQEHQPSRAELLNQLQDSQYKLDRCMDGFGEATGVLVTAAIPFDCPLLLDNQEMSLEEGGLLFTPFIETCYPYNSTSPYGDNALSEGELRVCAQYRHLNECLEAIADLMPDYFCATERIQP